MKHEDPALEQKAQQAFRRLRRIRSQQRRVDYIGTLPNEWRWRVYQLAAGGD